MQQFAENVMAGKVLGLVLTCCKMARKVSAFRLIPPDEHLASWQAGYDEILGPVFFGKTPSFEEMMSAAEKFERAFNPKTAIEKGRFVRKGRCTVMCEKNQPRRDRTKRFMQHGPALWRRRDQNEFDGQGGDAIRGAGIVFRMAWGHRLSGAGGLGDAVWLPLANAIRPEHTLTAFLSAVLMGASRFAHAGWLRHDLALHAMLGIARFPGEDAIPRLFHQFTQGRIEAFWRPLWVWLLGLLGGSLREALRWIWIRRFSIVRAAKGYNPRRPGRKSHHPILAVLAEAPFVLHAWLRSGNTSAGRGVVAWADFPF